MPIQLDGPGRSRPQPAPADDATLRSAIVNVAKLLPADGRGQDAGRDGGDHLAARQRRRRRPRRVLRGLRQPDAGAGAAGGGPAELGHRRHHLPVAAAQVGRRPGRPEPGLAGHHLGPAGRAGAWPLAPAGRRLPARSRATGCCSTGTSRSSPSTAGGVLHTIGGDSLPNFSVNAHQFPAPLAAQGVLGFVNNGELVSTAVGQSRPGRRPGAGHRGPVAEVRSSGGAGQQAARPGSSRGRRAAPAGGHPWMLGGHPGRAAPPEPATLPGYTRPTSRRRACRAPPPSRRSSTWWRRERSRRSSGTASRPRSRSRRPSTNRAGARASSRRRTTTCSGSREPARPAVTCGRRRSTRTAVWVTITAPFRVYHSVAESIADHSQLLATGRPTSRPWRSASPGRLRDALTGVYATDPSYGSNLIAFMRLYNLYRYDPTPTAAQAVAPPRAAGDGPRERWRRCRAFGSAERLPAGLRPGATPAGQRRVGLGRVRAVPGPPAGGRASRQGPPGQHPPLCVADSVGGDDRLCGDGQGAAARAQPLYQDVASRTGSGGSCWRPATGCSARPARATRRSAARS